MRKRLLALSLVFAVAAGVVGLANQVPAPGTAANATISGTIVTTSSPAFPIRHARVVLSNDTYWRAVLTEDDGKFSFRDLAPQQYKLEVSKPAYIKAEYGDTKIYGGGTRIALTTGQQMSNIVVKLARGAVLSGIVRDTAGAPAADVAVVAVSPGVRVPTTTNFRGEYRIYGLPPGDYVVSSQPPRGLDRFSSPVAIKSTADVDAELAELQRGRGRSGITSGAVSAVAVLVTGRASGPAPPQVVVNGYAPTYYPGTVDVSVATPITLREAEERGGLDFALILGGTSRIRGRVADAQGRPAAGALVTATASGAVRSTLSTSVTREGTFEIVNVSPGHYRLQVRANAPESDRNGRAASPSTTRWWALEEVDAISGDVTDVALTLQPPMTVGGRLVLDAASTPRRADPGGVRLNLIRQVAGADAPGPPTASGVVQKDGSFLVTGIDAGTFRLTATGGIANGAPWWLRTAVAGERDLLDRPIVFGPESGSIVEAVLTLSSRHTELVGTLRNPAGIAAPEYYIVVFPVDPSLWDRASRRLTFTRPATNGRFEFRELPPGDYFAAALTMLDTGEWTRRTFLEQLVRAGVKVTVTDGMRTVQNLQIRP